MDWIGHPLIIVPIMLGVLFVCGAGLIGCGAFIEERVSLPGSFAGIEQLRADAAKADPVFSEDIAGQVVKVNRYIREKQAYNQRWWAAWAIPNKWDDVELIPLPAGGQD